MNLNGNLPSDLPQTSLDYAIALSKLTKFTSEKIPMLQATSSKAVRTRPPLNKSNQSSQAYNNGIGTSEIEALISLATTKISAEQQTKRLARLEQMMAEVEATYKKANASGLRNYENAPQSVKTFYRRQRRGVSAAVTLKNQEKFLPLRNGKRSMWSTIQTARKYADGSDPDHIKAQLLHLYGAAEKARSKKMPNWFVLTCLIHDGGKFLMKWLPEHFVVGDTFPHLVPPSPKEIFYPEFQHNPDRKTLAKLGASGAYAPKCGLDNILMTWGHDEYLFQMVFQWIKHNAAFVKKSWKLSPLELRLMLYMLRFHSFYAFHREAGYQELWSSSDKKLRPYLRVFSLFDLYSKPEKLPAIKVLDASYRPFVEKFFPPKMQIAY